MWRRRRRICPYCGRSIAIVMWGKFYVYYKHKESPFGNDCLNNGPNGISWES